MSERVYIGSDEVWGYFQQNQDRFFVPEKIAENTDHGISVLLTSYEDFDRRWPLVLVYSDTDDVLAEEYIISEGDCANTVAAVYEEFLRPEFYIPREYENGFSYDEGEEEDDDYDLEFFIEEREDELSNAVSNMLDVVLERCIKPTMCDVSEITESVKEVVLDFLANECGFNIFRPMFLKDTEGDLYVEYPYDFIFESDDDEAVGF